MLTPVPIGSETLPVFSDIGPSSIFRDLSILARREDTGVTLERLWFAVPATVGSDKGDKLMALDSPIYLDNNATTPVDSRVADLVTHYSIEEYGNAGSRTHGWGSTAAKVVQKAREQVAEPVGATPDEVVFTSGATESNNLAILGIRDYGNNSNKRHIITTAIEHHAVLEPVEILTESGFEATILPASEDGLVTAESLAAALRPDTVLVSTMHANNETGVELPIDDYAQVLEGHDAWWHVDAAQTFGKRNGGLSKPRIDMISISGHKMFAPKGIGALVLRRRGYERPPLSPLMHGGGQERGLRPGTLPVALIAGLGLASELAQLEAKDRRQACEDFRQSALAALRDLGCQFNGDSSASLPHVANVSFPGIDAEAAIVVVKELIAISNGSACTSDSYEPSHVLTAMGLNQERIAGALRFSWNHHTAEPDWDQVKARLTTIIR